MAAKDRSTAPPDAESPSTERGAEDPRFTAPPDTEVDRTVADEVPSFANEGTVDEPTRVKPTTPSDEGTVDQRPDPGPSPEPRPRPDPSPRAEPSPGPRPKKSSDDLGERDTIAAAPLERTVDGLGEPLSRRAAADVGDEGTVDEAAPAPKKKRKRRIFRWILAIFGVLLALVAIAAGLAVIYWDEILRAVVIARAKQHGISLEFDKVDFDRKTNVVTLTRAHVRTDALSNVDVRADSIVVRIDDSFEPKTATATNVRAAISEAPGVTIVADRANVAIVDYAPKDFALEKVDVQAESLSDVTALAKVGLTEPLVSISPKITGLHARIAKLAPGWPVTLDLTASDLSMKPGSATLQKVETTIPIVDLPIALSSVTLAHAGHGFSLVVPDAPFLDLSFDESGRSAHVEIKKVPADLLAQKLGWSRPPGFALSATADVQLPEKEGAGLSGTFAATLDHYIPPHPAELDGIVFGDATKAKGSFVLVGGHATLSDLEADAGALHLKGKGEADVADAGKIDLSLTGSIPCNELAVGVIAVHVGFSAAMIGGMIAANHVTGTVEVRLGVTIRGKNASHPEIRPVAILHCGVRIL